MKHYLVPLLLISSISTISQAMGQEKKPGIIANIVNHLFSRPSSEQNLQAMTNGSGNLANLVEESSSNSERDSESSNGAESSHTPASITRLSTPPSLRNSTELKNMETLLATELDKEPKLADLSSSNGNSGLPITQEPVKLSSVELKTETTMPDRLRELGAFVVAAQHAVNQQQINEELTAGLKKWTLDAFKLKLDYPTGTPERTQINKYLRIMKNFGIKIDLKKLQEYDSPDEFSYQDSYDPKRELLKTTNIKLTAFDAEDSKYDNEEKHQLAHIEQISGLLRNAETKLGEIKHSRLKNETEKKETLEIKNLLIDLQKQDLSYVTAKIESLKKEITGSYDSLRAEHKKIDDETDLTNRSKMRNESTQFMQEISDKITSHEKAVKQLEIDKKSIADRLTPEELKATGNWKKALRLK